VGCVHNPSSNMMIASGVSPVAETCAPQAFRSGWGRRSGRQQQRSESDEEIDLAAKLAKITRWIPGPQWKAVVEMPPSTARGRCTWRRDRFLRQARKPTLL